MSQLRCPQCGAPVIAEHAKQYTTCENCGTIISIDRSSVSFNYIMPFILDEDKARAVFRRWCAGPSLAKDLEREAQITSVEKIYFPVFLFRRGVGGQEKSIIKPAKGTTLPGLQNQVIPPGDLRVFDSTVSTRGAEVIPPEISVETYLADLPGTAKEQALLYLRSLCSGTGIREPITSPSWEGTRGAYTLPDSPDVPLPRMHSLSAKDPCLRLSAASSDLSQHRSSMSLSLQELPLPC